jgi:hypothetical protein
MLGILSMRSCRCKSFYHITHGWVVETIAKELDHEIAKQLNYKSGGPARKHIGLAEAH